MDYYALKGDVVTCLSGHAIITIDKHMPFPTQIHNTVNLTDRGSALPIEACTPCCPQCRTPYARWAGGNIELHFTDGWREIYGPNRKPRAVQASQRQQLYDGLDTGVLRPARRDRRFG